MSKKEKKSEVAAKLSEKNKKIEDLLASVRKTFGEESVFHGDMPMKEFKVLRSGSTILDMTLGVGGWPYGRMVEVYGAESTGKTTLTLHAIAQAQAEGKVCAFIDVEHALDPVYASRLGVKIKDLIISQPDYGEQAMDIARTLASSGVVDLIVLDSVAALVPKVELEGDIEKANMGTQARLMSKSLRVLTGEVSKNNVLMFLINQTRMKIGVMFGNPETTAGGESLKFYASMRLRVSRGQKIMEGDKQIGGGMVVKVVKNKVAPPFTQCEIPVIFGDGIDKVGDLYSVAKEWEVFELGGGTHYLGEEKLASKKDDMIARMRNEPELFKRIEDLVREKAKSKTLKTEATEQDLEEAKEKAPQE